MTKYVTDFMIDIENLDVDFSTRIHSVVLSIGIVGFNSRQKKNGIIYRHYEAFGTRKLRNSQEDKGRTISEETVKWWKNQSPEAKKVFKEATCETVEEGLQRIADFVNDKGCDNPRIWGNGSDFDVSIVTDLMCDYGIKVPWKFHQFACYRTMKASHSHKITLPEYTGEKHNALVDAEQQAHGLMEIYSVLQKMDELYKEDQMKCYQ